MRSAGQDRTTRATCCRSSAQIKDLLHCERACFTPVTPLTLQVARAIAWSSNGLHLAVGMAGGGVKILDAANLQPLYWKKDR